MRRCSAVSQQPTEDAIDIGSVIQITSHGRSQVNQIGMSPDESSATAERLLDGRRDTALLARPEDPVLVRIVVASIALADIDPLGRDPVQASFSSTTCLSVWPS